MTKLIMLSLCLGLFAGMPLISAAQSEAINQGQITYADDHGTSKTDNPSQPEGALKVTPACNNPYGTGC